jgi:glycyl-tRNA synthetase
MFLAVFFKRRNFRRWINKNSTKITFCGSAHKGSSFTIGEKRRLPEIAHKIVEDLKWDFNVTYDEKDAVGRRYRRQDALGTCFVLRLIIKR